MSAEPRYRPGDQPIDGYRLVDCIRSTPDVEEWRAHDEAADRTVTVRVLDLRRLTFGREEAVAFDAVRRLHHDNILPILNARLRADDQPGDGTVRWHELVVVTPWVGATLGSRLRERNPPGTGPEQAVGLPVSELLRHMEQAAAGIDYLNHAGPSWRNVSRGPWPIVHADIRPDNLALCDGKVQLQGCELAAVFAPGRRPRRAGGDPRYRAPELTTDAPGAGTDQFALAICYHELRTGRLPYPPDATAAEVLALQTAGRLDWTEHSLKPDEVEVLRKATAADPGGRYPSCRAFVAALRAAIEAVRAGPTLGSMSLGRPAGRSDAAIPAQAPPPAGRAPAQEVSLDEDEELADEDEEPRERAKRRAAPVTRRATVRYYSRMNPQRTFPLLVVLSPGEIAAVVKKHVEQAASRGFAADPSAPVEVEPVLPGCGVYPPKDTVEVGGDEPKTLTFYVVPQVLGTVLGGRVAVRQGGRLLADIPLSVKVRRTTLAWVLAGLGLLAPYATSAAKSANLDWESQKAAGFPLVQTALQVGADLLRPEWLGLGLLGLAAGVWLYLRPRRREVFWDVNPKG